MRSYKENQCVIIRFAIVRRMVAPCQLTLNRLQWGVRRWQNRSSQEGLRRRTGEQKHLAADALSAQIMQYIAAVSGGQGSSSIQEIKDMVLATNPLLESFG